MNFTTFNFIVVHIQPVAGDARAVKTTFNVDAVLRTISIIIKALVDV
jgi:hypothetical protein